MKVFLGAIAIMLLSTLCLAADGVRLTWDHSNPSGVSRFLIKQSVNGGSQQQVWVSPSSVSGGSVALPNGGRQYVHTVGPFNRTDLAEFRIAAEGAGGAMSPDSNALVANLADLNADVSQGYFVFPGSGVSSGGRVVQADGQINRSGVLEAVGSGNCMSNPGACPIVAGGSVQFSKAGNWYLWGRFSYVGAIGSNDANSFWLCVGSQPCVKFGNNKDLFGSWHWDGDGNKESGPASPAVINVPSAGFHDVVVRVREVVPVPPKLDVVFMSEQASSVPTDSAAVDALYPPVTTTTLPPVTTTTLPPVEDECDSTSQCKAQYGDRATDCKNSQSNSSVCMCGNVACSSLPPTTTTVPPTTTTVIVTTTTVPPTTTTVPPTTTTLPPTTTTVPPTTTTIPPTTTTVTGPTTTLPCVPCDQRLDLNGDGQHTISDVMVHLGIFAGSNPVPQCK